VVFLSCGSPLLPPSYEVAVPELPSHWREVLGPCRWRVEWIGAGGERETEDYGGGVLEAELPHAWPNPVLAWPYWPDKGIYPGLFRPAGALYPLDVQGRFLVLSWEAGPEAFFYTALDRASGSAGTDPQRRPQYFDWPRFRTYLRTASSELVLSDPWRVNWKSAAEAALGSGFRTTLIKPESGEEAVLSIPADGPWIGSSPFAGPFSWTKDEAVSLELKSEAEIFVSPAGIFAVSSDSRLWSPF
jgi:hypothetical protein